MNKDLHIYWINSCCTILFQASRINYYILTNGPVVFCESLPSRYVYYISTKFRMQKSMMLKVEKLQRIQKSLAKHILQHLQAMGDLVWVLTSPCYSQVYCIEKQRKWEEWNTYGIRFTALEMKERENGKCAFKITAERRCHSFFSTRNFKGQQ
jgi:hypothetical protein